MAPPVDMQSEVGRAIAAFAAGKPVMVFDSDFRERETDLLWPAGAATPEVIRTLRNDCGGLLFLAIGNEIGETLGCGCKTFTLINSCKEILFLANSLQMTFNTTIDLAFALIESQRNFHWNHR